MHQFLHHLFHPVRILWTERAVLFWPIWLGITALGLFIVMRVIPRRSEISSASAPSRRLKWSRQSTFAIVLLALFLGCYLAGLLVWEDFTYYDNSHYTNETLIGRNISLQISPEQGRFWPLGYQEFNLLRHITSSITGYHALRIAQLALVCSILLTLDEELSVVQRVALILSLLITPSIVISFSGLIYPEANLICWIVCLAWCLQRFERTQSRIWAAAAVLFAQLILYYKETAFLFLLGFMAGRILLRCRDRDEAGWDWRRLRNPQSRLDLCLALLSGVYVLYYLAVLFPHFGASYAVNNKLPLVQVLDAYLELDLLVWIFVGVCAIRAFLFVRWSLTPSLLWDGLAIGGLCYLAGFILLRLESSYYLAPVDLVAVLYVGRLAFLSLRERSMAIKLCALTLVFVVCAQDLSLSAFRMYERKNVIHAKTEIGHAIKDRYDADPQSVKRLFFPFAEPFPILEFASYLQYIGVPIEQQGNGAETASGVLLIAKSIHEDGPCGYRAFLCHPGSTPNVGDLVIVFPDDVTSISETNSYRQAGSPLLLSYSPRPQIPDWMRPLVNRLHIVSPIFTFRPLPDSWLMASIAIWN
jgi:hypothetical protein